MLSKSALYMYNANAYILSMWFHDTNSAKLQQTQKSSEMKVFIEITHRIMWPRSVRVKKKHNLSTAAMAKGRTKRREPITAEYDAFDSKRKTGTVAMRQKRSGCQFWNKGFWASNKTNLNVAQWTSGLRTFQEKLILKKKGCNKSPQVAKGA